MDKQLLAKINSLYSLPTLSYKGKAKGGFLSDNYVLQTKTSTYFLKKYRQSVGDRLPVITKTEQFFANADIPIILPILTKKGSSFFSVEGYHYSLYPFISGKTFDHNNRVPTMAMVASIARNLAKMHQISRKGFPLFSKAQLSEWDVNRIMSDESRDGFYLYAHKILDVLKAKKRKTKFDLLAAKVVKLKLGIVQSVPTSFKGFTLGKPHIVHGDYHAQNVFLNGKGEVTHVFDLEKTDARPRSLELVRSMLLICFSGQFTSARFALAKKYLAAYNEIYPIPAIEVESSIRLLYYKHTLNLWIEKGHYFNDFTRADVLLDGELRYLRYMSKNMNHFIKRVLS